MQKQPESTQESAETGGLFDDVAGLKIDLQGAIGWIILDRAAKRNCLTQTLWSALPATIRRMEADNNVRVVVVRGAGEESFCAGADISEFATMRRNADTARQYEKANEDAFAAIRLCNKPVIAMIHGYCLGGGFGLAAACDLRLASDSSVFGVPAARLGLAYPLTAMADIVHAVGPQTAKEMLYSARRFSAQQMLDRRFLMEITTRDALQDTVDHLCADIAAGAPLSQSAAKLAIRSALSGDPDDRSSAENAGRRTFDSADYAEGCAAFLAKRPANFTGE